MRRIDLNQVEVENWSDEIFRLDVRYSIWDSLGEGETATFYTHEGKVIDHLQKPFADENESDDEGTLIQISSKPLNLDEPEADSN